MTVDAASVLLARHEQLRSRAGSAARVLQLVDDPDTGAPDLARALGSDPVLAGRVLRVANSTYYGLSGRVSTLPYAVSVLGFQTVRSLAVVAATGLDDPAALPPGFWQAAALSATAAEYLSKPMEADPGDAFSLGLLHTFGAALLHQHEPPGLLCLPETSDPAEQALLELDRYGITHEQAGARVLSSWQIPERICTLIGRHHEPLLPSAPPLERVLHAARYLADRALREDLETPGDESIAWITEGRVTAADVPAQLAWVRDRAAALLDGLLPRNREPEPLSRNR